MSDETLIKLVLLAWAISLPVIIVLFALAKAQGLS